MKSSGKENSGGKQEGVGVDIEGSFRTRLPSFFKKRSHGKRERQMVTPIASSTNWREFGPLTHSAWEVNLDPSTHQRENRLSFQQ